jgi:uncharacterized protein YdiU (UPF0061 family)
MNTDNMSILGLTIDYGPYGWLEGYDPLWTPNTTDAQGRRYAYGQQPHIAQWNLVRLAEALLPLIPKEELEQGLALYAETFNSGWQRAFMHKLGLAAWKDEDVELLPECFKALAEAETDFTLFFRNLAGLNLEQPSLEPLRRAFYTDAPRPLLQAWIERYAARVREEGVPAAVRMQRMNAVNPKYVPRNYLAQQAIDAIANGDASVLERLMDVLKQPYDDQPEHDALAERRPEWARSRAGCSALSCSS